MELLQFACYSGIAMCAVLIPVYIAALIRVLQGSKYKLIVALTLMLIFQNLAYIGVFYFDIKFMLKDETNHINFVMQGVCFGLQFLLFNLAHYQLAWQYRKLSNDIPKIFEAEESNSSVQINPQRTLYWALLCFNVIPPVALPFVLIPWNEKVFTG